MESWGRPWTCVVHANGTIAKSLSLKLFPKLEPNKRVFDWTLVICCPENRFLSFTSKNVKNHRRGILTWYFMTALFIY